MATDSTRVKVYAFLGLVLAVGGGYWAQQKYQIFGKLGTAKADSKKKDDAAKKGETEAVAVELALAKTGDLAVNVSSSGNLRALRDVAVATQAEGIVQKVLAEEGDYVEEGRVLAQIDDRPIRIRLELAKERLAQAGFQHDKAKLREEKARIQIAHYEKEYERYRKANEQGLVSETEAERRRLQRDEYVHDQRIAASEIVELTHRMGELKSEISQIELDLTRTQLKAPFGGFITRRTAEIGQRVRALDPMFNLGAFSPLYADVFLSEREARQVRPGQAAVVQLGSEGEAKVTGRIERLSPVVDQASGTVKITVELRPPGREFRPGAFVRVEIRTDTRNGVLMIPKRAVIEEDGQSFVYVTKDGNATRRKVKIGHEWEGRVEVSEGLESGQQVVVAGQGGLKEGSKVKVQG